MAKELINKTKAPNITRKITAPAVKVKSLVVEKNVAKPRKLVKRRRFPNSLNIGLKNQKEMMIENLALMISAGLDILQAFEAVNSEADSWQIKKLVKVLTEEIENGSTLWRSLEYTKAFPAQTISLVRVGEESGRLVENLNVVILQQRKQREFNSKIRSAMMYPSFVLFITFVVGLSITWFILPRLTVVFSSLNVKLPLITQLLIAFGKFLSDYGNVFVPAVIGGLLVLLYVLFVFRPTKFIGQFFSLHTPGISKLVIQTEVARFGFVFGTLMEAGMPLIYALDSLKKSTEFRAYKKFYTYLIKSLEEGNSFRQSFDDYKRSKKLLPKSIQQLISAGEKSGNLSKTLLKIGDIYEEKIEMTTKNLSIILEPLLLFIVWLGVLAVAIAVILPIYSLVGNFNPS